MRQEYDRAFLQKIVDQYKNLGVISEQRLFTSGFENSNYFVNTEAGPYVVKIFEGFGVSPENIRFEVEIMDASYQGGVKSPHVLRNSGGALVTEAGGKPSIIMGFIEGENMAGKELPDKLVSELGFEAGKMDTLLSSFTDGSLTRQNYEFDLKSFLILEEKIEFLPNGFDKDVFRHICDTFRKLKPAFDECPSGIIHNDIVAHNLLVRDGELAAIIDFSDMAFSPYIQNVAVTFAQTFFALNWKPHQGGIFLGAYRQNHPISEKEESLLYDLVLTRYAQLILEMNHWNVLYGEDQQRTVFIRDSYSFISKLHNLGRTEFNRALR